MFLTFGKHSPAHLAWQGDPVKNRVGLLRST
jgi:hypothetical protein